MLLRLLAPSALGRAKQAPGSKRAVRYALPTNSLPLRLFAAKKKRAKLTMAFTFSLHSTTAFLPSRGIFMCNNPPASKEWTARGLFAVSGAYWAGCALQAAVQLDLFTALHDGALAMDELADHLGCNKRAFGMLLGALASMELVERKDGLVSAAPSALPFLSRKSPGYAGFIIKHHFNIMPGWAQLDKAVLTGSSTAKKSTRYTTDHAEREDFLMGMYNIARLQAELLADTLDLSGRKHLLDVGGGPGTYALYFCKKNPELRATIFDLPTTEAFAAKTIASFGLGGRVEFMAGNFLTDNLPKGHDVAWLSQVLHGESPAGAAALIKNAASCLAPGGLVCVQEFVLDEDRNGPEQAALFSLNMLVQTPGGQAYTAGEIGDMLRAAGAAKVSLLDVTLPMSCKVITGEFR